MVLQSYCLICGVKMIILRKKMDYFIIFFSRKNM